MGVQVGGESFYILGQLLLVCVTFDVNDEVGLDEGELVDQEGDAVRRKAQMFCSDRAQFLAVVRTTAQYLFIHAPIEDIDQFQQLRAPLFNQ